MKTLPIQELREESFQQYGFYKYLFGKDTPLIGNKPIEFYRDIIQLSLGNTSAASFSICTVAKRDPVIDVVECHDYTSEGIYPIDSDILIHVAYATPNGPELDSMEVFKVPRHTMVVLRPGTWHHAPFAYDSLEANILIVLPERTYKNDCFSVELSDTEKIRIQTG